MLQYSGEGGTTEKAEVAPFRLEHADKGKEQGQIVFADEAAQAAEVEVAKATAEKLMQDPPGRETSDQVNANGGENPTESRSTSSEACEVNEDEAKRAHEEAEAQRLAEWQAKQAAKKAAEEEKIRLIAAMGEDELVMAATKRISTDTERLTRRSMKECISEHIQIKCLEDLEFARLTMHPRKSMIHCIWYINRKAKEYLQKEMEDNGLQPESSANGMYGGDVPDELCYGWAEEYFRTLDAEEDKEKEEKFIPKPYTGSQTVRSKKRSKPGPKKTPKEAKAKDDKEALTKAEPVDENQITLGDLAQMAS